MPGLLGRFSLGKANENPGTPPILLHRPGNTKLTQWQNDTGFVQHAQLEFDTLGKTVYAEAGLRGWFYGDLPAHDNVPWETLFFAVRSGKPHGLAEITSPFVAVILEESTGRVWLISDRRSQHPIFYRLRDGGLDFSTLTSAFNSSLGGAQFAPEWLYELFYFNYPVMETTFYKGVRRLPPATILSWEPGSETAQLQNYAPPFTRPDRFVSGDEATELALSTFAEVAAECFQTQHPIAVALTGGFDARAVLSYAPPADESDLLTFTYGLPGCPDITEAAKVAAQLGLDHLAVEFDEAFLEKLPHLLAETVMESDGRERVIRATLPHVFSTLATAGRRVLVSGISGDHIFRDHIRGRGNVPALMSKHLMDYIETGDAQLNDPFYKELFGADHPAFKEHIAKTLKALEQRHGLLSKPEGYVRFLVYEIATKYFGGEAALASQSLIYRTPYWDSRVVELAFILDRGTVGLSELLPAKDRFIEAGLQANLIHKSPHYSKGTVKGISANAFVRGNRRLYQLERLVKLGPKKMSRLARAKPAVPLEDWAGWMGGVLTPRINTILSDKSALNTYVQIETIRNLKASGDLIRVGQLLTAELILDLSEKGWV